MGTQFLVTPPGFEPGPTLPKRVVLPLHHGVLAEGGGLEPHALERELGSNQPQTPAWFTFLVPEEGFEPSTFWPSAKRLCQLGYSGMVSPAGFEPASTDRKSVILSQARRWGHLISS